MNDNLKDAIIHERKAAENLKEIASTIPTEDEYYRERLAEYLECITKQEQLVTWLEELEQRREADKWIPISEKRLPRRNGVYNVTRIIDGTAISDACYFDGQNTWHEDTRVNHGRPYVTDITAWQPLPEPYKESEA